MNDFVFKLTTISVVKLIPIDASITTYTKSYERTVSNFKLQVFKKYIRVFLIKALEYIIVYIVNILISYKLFVTR